MARSSDQSPGSPYNSYRPDRSEEFERSWKPSYVSEATRRALEELEYIASWAEFVEICEKQKRRRGW